MKRKLEDKLTKAVDGDGRSTAESLINKQYMELLEDISELIVKAVTRNPENPWAELGIDKSSMKEVVSILLNVIGKFKGENGKKLTSGQKLAKRKAIDSVKKSVNRLDVCYLASAANLAERKDREISTLKDRIETIISNGVRDPYKNEAGSATPSSKRRKFVPKSDTTKRLREDAKLLIGKPLQTKVLNVVEKRLETEGFMMGQNAVQITNAMHGTLKETVEMAADAVRLNPYLSGRELERQIRADLGTKFAKSKTYTKVASRAVVSSSLNVVICEEIERLVSNGILKNEDFFLNRPTFVYKAVMDMRTSDICRTLNGMLIPLNDKARLMRFMPPQHGNCRSVLIPNLRN